MPAISANKPTPLVKWVGGKRQLQVPILEKILEVFDPHKGTYFEPFFGGGAIFFALNPAQAKASDINHGLVNLYNQVISTPALVKEEALKFELEYNLLSGQAQSDYYLAKRKEFNTRVDSEFLNRLGVRGAALFLFLNKAGFNGMYRENASGEFNIPFGKRDKIKLFEELNLDAASGALARLTINRMQYSETVRDAKEGDLVYFDPPYAPLSSTSSFESYNSENLGGFDQVALRDLVVELTNRRVHCLVSNSSAPIIEELYKDFNLVPLNASRAISASADGRKKVKEYLIDNFKQVQG
jgi:DNA adenine methylase